MIKESTVKRLDELNVIDMYQSKKMGIGSISRVVKTGKAQLKQYLSLKGINIIHDRRSKAPIGEHFGDWTVISDEVKYGHELGLKNTVMYWKVQCKCGEIGWREVPSLKKGVSKRCRKCFSKKYRTLTGQIDISWCLDSIYNRLKLSAMRRKKVSKLEFTLTLEDLKELYLNNSTCALSGIDLTWNENKTILAQNLSVDRIDSNKGYTKDNVELVDKRINMMKGSLSNEEFIKLCTLVADYNRNKCE